MSDIVGKKPLCSTCHKAAGILTCRGCEKDFCYRHVTEHRQELNIQMDGLTTNHDQLQQTISDQEAQPTCHPLIENINAWEKESIDKIHQAADIARKQVLTIITTYRTQVVRELGYLTIELNKARNEDDYVETDLKEWTDKLDKLKKDLTAPQTIDFNENSTENSWIPKIFINDASTDMFYQSTGDAQISEGGKYVVHGPTDDIAVVCCRGEYSLGQHRFRFKIEQFSQGTGFSCGIISKSTPKDSITNTVNYNVYGYAYTSSGTYQRLNHNVVYSFNEQNYNFKVDDIYEIFIDCNRKMMRLTNERTSQGQDISIDVDACSFPWQFFIAFFYANDRVRLC
jgi:hypothetical protein